MDLCAIDESVNKYLVVVSFFPDPNSEDTRVMKNKIIKNIDFLSTIKHCGYMCEETNGKSPIDPEIRMIHYMLNHFRPRKVIVDDFLSIHGKSDGKRLRDDIYSGLCLGYEPEIICQIGKAKHPAIHVAGDMARCIREMIEQKLEIPQDILHL